VVATDGIALRAALLSAASPAAPTGGV